jgi:hypothetical protein
MKKHKELYLLVMTVVFALAFWPGPAWCRLNLPQLQEQKAIGGPDHQALKEFLARFDRRGGNGFATDRVRAVLIAALPESFRQGCGEVVGNWGTLAEGTATLSVKVLYVDSGKQDIPAKALLAYGCFSTAREYANRYRDERLGLLVVGRDSSRLTLIPDVQDCENCSELSRITLDKVIRLFGRTVVGLSFLKSTDNPCCGGPDSFKEERVNLYVMKENGIKQAGSLLKRQDHRSADATSQDEHTLYEAGLILKKDMKGNIVGILSPYKIKKNNKLTQKGMIRYNWNMEKEEFIKE